MTTCICICSGDVTLLPLEVTCRCKSKLLMADSVIREVYLQSTTAFDITILYFVRSVPRMVNCSTTNIGYNKRIFVHPASPYQLRKVGHLLVDTLLKEY